MENYVLIKKLGEGGFGSVYLCQHVHTQQQYVMKQIDITEMTPKQLQECQQEISFLKTFQHLNICEAYDTFVTTVQQHGLTIRYLCLIMYYCDAGDLEQYLQSLRQSRQTMSESTLVQYLIQICLALRHIHERKVIHRDLKPGNVFLTSSTDGTPNSKIVKLGDFGIARLLEHTFAQANTQIGTPYYLSPEICKNKPYDHHADIWSLGCVLYEMMALKHPFNGSNLNQLVIQILTTKPAPLPTSYSQELRTLCIAMLQKNPQKRPSINDILHQPFIQKHIANLLDTQQRLSEHFHPLKPTNNKPNTANSNGKVDHNAELRAKLIAIEKQRIALQSQQQSSHTKKPSLAVVASARPSVRPQAVQQPQQAAPARKPVAPSPSAFASPVQRQPSHQPSSAVKSPVASHHNHSASDLPTRQQKAAQDADHKAQLMAAHAEQARIRREAAERGRQYHAAEYGMLDQLQQQHFAPPVQTAPNATLPHQHHRPTSEQRGSRSEPTPEQLARAREEAFRERQALAAKHRANSGAAAAHAMSSIDDDDSGSQSTVNQQLQNRAQTKQAELAKKEAALAQARKEAHEDRIRLQQKHQQAAAKPGDDTALASPLSPQKNDGLTVRLANHLSNVDDAVGSKSKVEGSDDTLINGNNQSLSQLVEDMLADAVADRAAADESVSEVQQRQATEAKSAMDDLRAVLDNGLNTTVPQLNTDDDGAVAAAEDDDIEKENMGKDSYAVSHAKIDSTRECDDLLSTQSLHLPDFSDKTMRDFAALNLSVTLKPR